MSTKRLLALVSSHIDGDEEQFLSIALQVAAQEASQGWTDEADKLRPLVQNARAHDRSGQQSAWKPLPYTSIDKS